MKAVFVTVFSVLCVAAAASAERYQLRTGEWLSESEYGYFQPLGGERILTLSVKFESDADPDLREQSQREIVSRHLLPRAMREGFSHARLLETRVAVSLGIFHANSYEDWDFEHSEGYQWTQISGPPIDWTLVTQNLVYDDETGFEVPERFLETRYESGHYFVEYRVIASDTRGPQEALTGFRRLISRVLDCDNQNALIAEYISDPKFQFVRIRVQPERQDDWLDIVPSVQFTYGPTDGSWACSEVQIEAALMSIDLEGVDRWDDLIR